MAGVFISYRREDSPGHAGRVFDRVRARFGSDVVFMDVTAIEAGVDFVDAIERAVGTCDVLLAVIGPQWSSSADGTGHRRLDSPTDFVRIEIAGALKRDVRVVPVLVDGARLPAAADLPDILQPLLRRNAVELRDARWDADIDQLLASLERIVKPREEPLRLEAAPHRRLRWLAGLAVLAVSVGAAAVLGAKACSPAPEPVNITTATPPTATTPPAATPPSATTPRATTPRTTTPRATTPPAAAATATVPDVVGRLLPDARDILKRAGVDVARVLYRDDRTKAIDLVVVQTDVRTSAGSPPAVALTAVARAAVIIRHTPEDADLARGLLGALMSSSGGLAIRTLEGVRSEGVARVTYSDPALASTAADITKEANEWLQRTEPGRPALTASVSPPVVSRTLVIGLPQRGSTSSTTAPLPDVRGLTLADARRKLSAAGVTAFDYKWSDDPGRTPLEVFDQTELPARAGGRMVGLSVGAKGTLSVSYLANDAPIVERLGRDLSARVRRLGVLVRLVRVTAVRPSLVGKVVSGTDLSKEASSIATFASSWLTTESGRSVSVEAVTLDMAPKQLTFLFPSLQ